MIYRKTSKAVIEIETRVHRLAQRLRMTLILIDGRRHDHELKALIPGDANEVFAALLETGYIEALPEALP